MHTPSVDRSVVSPDGTTLALTTVGDGPALVVVAGPTGTTRSADEIVALAAAFSTDFTVTTYDRRGRGASGDTLPWVLEREVEDLRAVVEASGDHAHVVALCTGSGLVLHALAAGVPIDRAVLYEPSYRPGATAADGERVIATLGDLVGGGRLGAAVGFFLVEVLGVPRFAALLVRLRRGLWRQLLAGARGLVRDATVMDGFVLRPERFAGIDRPVLVVAGGDSTDRLKIAAQEVVHAVPGSAHTVLQNQNHRLDPVALAPVATRFLTGADALR